MRVGERDTGGQAAQYDDGSRYDRYDHVVRAAELCGPEFGAHYISAWPKGDLQCRLQ